MVLNFRLGIEIFGFRVFHIGFFVKVKFRVFYYVFVCALPCKAIPEMSYYWPYYGLSGMIIFYSLT